MKLPKLIIPSFTQHILLSVWRVLFAMLSSGDVGKKISQDTAPIFEESGGGFHAHLLI